MDWSTVGKVISSAAPVLGGVLGGPPGAAIGAGVSLLLKGLGLSPDTKPEDVVKSLELDPASYVKLREIEANERNQLVELHRSQLLAQLEDLKSARQHEVDLARVGHLSSYAPVVISLTVVLGFFSACALLIFRPPTMSDSVMAILNILIGALVTAFTQVTSFYLGSSAGSSIKTKLLALAPALKEKGE